MSNALASLSMSWADTYLRRPDSRALIKEWLTSAFSAKRCWVIPLETPQFLHFLSKCCHLLQPSSSR